MGLRSVSVSSNEKKAKPALDIKRRTGKKPDRITDAPVAKTSLQKISEFTSNSKTLPRVSATSESQVCKAFAFQLPFIYEQQKIHPASFDFFSQDVSHRLHVQSKASLKDLCPEDKRRIANLIEELAKYKCFSYTPLTFLWSCNTIREFTFLGNQSYPLKYRGASIIKSFMINKTNARHIF